MSRGHLPHPLPIAPSSGGEAVIGNVVARGDWVDLGAFVWQESLGTLSQVTCQAQESPE